MKNALQFLLNVAGLGVVFGSLYLGVFTLGDVEPFAFFIHYPSLLVVLGGVIGIALATSHCKMLIQLLISLVFKSATSTRQRQASVEGKLSQLAELYYKEGNSEVAKKIMNDSDFSSTWKIAAQKLDAKIAIADIKMIVDLKRSRMIADINSEISLLKKLMTLAPSFGMFGTILGLVKLLANLQDFSAIGPNMSLALLTTLYGIFVAQVIIGPMVAKIENLKVERIKNIKQILLWLHLIEQRKPAFYLDSSRRPKEIKRA